MNASNIGLCIGMKLDDEKKLMFLKNTWTPMHGYVFPVQKQGKQNRSFQIDWLNVFKWLAYSELRMGGFCKYCVLFSLRGGSKGNQVIIPSLLFNKLS